MQVPKASKIVIQSNVILYEQQLYSLQQQLIQQNMALSYTVTASELPYLQHCYQTMLRNIKEKIDLCIRLESYFY